MTEMLRVRYLLTLPDTDEPPAVLDYDQIAVPAVGVNVEVGPDIQIRQWVVAAVYWILHEQIPADVVVICEPESENSE